MQDRLRDLAAGILDEFEDGENELEPPEIKNYKTYIPRFSIEALQARLATRARTNPKASEEALAELIMLHRDFRKGVLLVCWATGISELVADTAM